MNKHKIASNADRAVHSRDIESLVVIYDAVQEMRMYSHADCSPPFLGSCMLQTAGKRLYKSSASSLADALPKDPA